MLIELPTSCPCCGAPEDPESICGHYIENDGQRGYACGGCIGIPKGHAKWEWWGDGEAGSPCPWMWQRLEVLLQRIETHRPRARELAADLVWKHRYPPEPSVCADVQEILLALVDPHDGLPPECKQARPADAEEEGGVDEP